MSLQRKSLIAFIVILAVTLIIFVTVMSIFLPNRIREIEQEAAGSDLGQAGVLLDDTTGQTASACRDWASWDDTYAFIRDRNQGYINSNLPDETFINLEINHMVFYDDNGEEVLSKGYDFSTEEEIPLPEDYRHYLKTNLIKEEPVSPPLSGTGVMGEKPVIIAAYPILDSQEEGTARGTLVFIRDIDERIVDRLSRLAGIDLGVYLYSDANLPEAILNARDNPGGDDIQTWVVSKNIINGIMVIEDIFGQPALIVEGNLERTYYPMLFFFGRDVIIGLMAVLVMAAGVTALLMRRWVMSPLTDLSRNIRNLSITAALDKRLPVRGRDEISQVAGCVNGMLDALEETRGALAESSEQYRDLFENAHDLIHSVDRNGRFLYTNPTWRKTLGYTLEEIDGVSLFDIIHPDSQEHCRDFFNRVISGEDIKSIEAAFISRSGEKIWVVGSSSCRFIEGKPVYTRGIFHDITDVENARLNLEEAYEKQKNLSENLQEEIQRRVEIVRIISHELKNSLTSLMASSEMLTELTAAEGDPLKSLTRNIDRSASHLYKRVQEMLDMARLEMGTLTIEAVPVEPEKILINIAEDVRPLAESRGQQITMEIPQGLPLIMADPDRLWQVCLNLLDNASRHTPSGGTITIGAEVEGEFLKIFVRDTGKGIDKEAMVNLFDSYGKTRSRTGGSGLGLGLSLCRSFVELHGGHIRVESETGKGSTFFFTMPLYREEHRQ